MMARHTEVGQDAVNVFHVVIAHPVGQISEIASDEREVLLSFWHILLCVGILVETEEMAAARKS